MAKGPDRPNAPRGRDPAKHSKKDPAKPTRAKAARPDTPHLDPALAELLNPAIGRGRAGVGSQTGIEHQTRRDSVPSPLVGEGGREEKSRVATGAQERSSEPARRLPTPTPSPSPQGGGEVRAESPTSKLEQPPDNSFDRRADFSSAHRARASVARGFGEPPQQSYVGKTPVPPGELDPDLARALGIDEPDSEDDADPSSVITPDGPRAIAPAAGARRSRHGRRARQPAIARQAVARRPAGISPRR